jgi:hypothetical protein
MTTSDKSGGPVAAKCSRAGTEADHTARLASSRAASTSESSGRHSACSASSVERRASPWLSWAMRLSRPRRNGPADVGVTADSRPLGRRLVVRAGARVDLDRPRRVIADVGSPTPPRVRTDSGLVQPKMVSATRAMMIASRQSLITADPTKTR